MTATTRLTVAILASVFALLQRVTVVVAFVLAYYTAPVYIRCSYHAAPAYIGAKTRPPTTCLHCCSVRKSPGHTKQLLQLAAAAVVHTIHEARMVVP